MTIDYMLLAYTLRDYSNDFELLPFAYRRLGFQITFQAPRDTGDKISRKFYSFTPTGLLETYLYGQKRKK